MEPDFALTPVKAVRSIAPHRQLTPVKPSRPKGDGWLQSEVTEPIQLTPVKSSKMQSEAHRRSTYTLAIDCHGAQLPVGTGSVTYLSSPTASESSLPTCASPQSRRTGMLLSAEPSSEGKALP